MNILVTIILIYSILHVNNCLYLDGHIDSDKDWIFVGKFCFLPYTSSVTFKISYPSDYGYHSMLLYYEEQWSGVYPNKDLSCTEKENKIPPTQNINLAPINILSSIASPECVLNGIEVKCEGSRTFIGGRPYWWFIVFSRCSPPNNTNVGIKLDYSFSMLNGNGVFVRQFSADEIGIFETSIFMFLVYIILIIITAIFAKLLALKSLFHSTFKIYIGSLIFELLSFLFIMSEYAQFSSNGKFTSGCLLVGRLCDAIAQTVFLLMLILLAKGYTVTRGRLRTVTVVKIIVLFSLYIIAYLVCFCYAEILFDPGLVNYFYGSPPGIALILIKLIFGWLWFCYSIVFTVKNYPEKRPFYYPFVIFYTLWFLAGPIAVIICSYVVSLHIRQKTGFIIQSSIAVLGHIYFMILTSPLKANQNFPYHTPTNAIGVESHPEDTQNFPHHKEGEGGNKEFDVNNHDLTLTDIFSVNNTGSKYRMNQQSNGTAIIENNV